jgi:hypothetical protein
VNAQNCGACGTACKPGETCTDGHCSVACPGGEATCNGLCYDLSNDLQHCGKCDVACKAGEVCGNGQCSANCPQGQDNCGGSCANLQTDPKHCGACPTACDATQECDAGKCVIACKTQLNQAIPDPWGWSWDGLERAATSWDVAKKTCEGFRGRLPTASELYRVSATQSATVGQTINTNSLWSMVPYGAASRVTVKLSDASVGNAPVAGPLNYRCVCPPPVESVFSGHNCFGPATGACYGIDGENKKYNIDVADHAPLSKGAAIWECDFYHGHLPSPRMVAEAIQQGIGAGSGHWLHTSDDVHYAYDLLVNWSTGTGFSYGYIGATNNGANSLSWAATTGYYPFRCVGENYAAGPHPAAIPDEWVSPSGKKSTTKDQTAVSYVQAADACFAAGGHLPNATELAQLIVAGLPGGTNAWLWTSEQTGFDGTSFTVMVERWQNVDATHLYANTGNPDTDITWVYKGNDANGNPYNKFAYRCVFYPVDTTYAGPATALCAGGCTPFALPGASGAKMWIDNFDRAPGATSIEAIDACRKVGGHLAGERDLFEGVRRGLPNGSGASGTWVWTSDTELGNQPMNPYLLLGVGKWTGADPKYDDLWPTYTTWANANDATLRPYRCMWTNEIR